LGQINSATKRGQHKNHFFKQGNNNSHELFEKRYFYLKTFFEAKAKIKQDYLKKCNDSHVCMLVLNFKNLGMLQTNPLKMKLTLVLWNG
jgi:hypothetical protein